MPRTETKSYPQDALLPSFEKVDALSKSISFTQMHRCHQLLSMLLQLISLQQVWLHTHFWWLVAVLQCVLHVRVLSLWVMPFRSWCVSFVSPGPEMLHSCTPTWLSPQLKSTCSSLSTSVNMADANLCAWRRPCASTTLSNPTSRA